jgi:SAM-dependent methyltransferase
MTTTTTTPTEQRDALAERLFGGLLESFELLSVQVGLELGLYAVLDTDGPADAGELAERAGIHRRYAREWLEQQAAAGFLDVASDSDDADRRRFALSAGHAEALLDPDSPASVSAIGPALLGLAGVFDPVVAAYRSGGGVSFADYGTGIRHGIAGMNRPMFTNDLASWLAAAPAVDQRLRTSQEPRILDVGCGTGWSSIALARAYPGARVVGIDLDAASVDDAQRNALAAGVGERVRFEVRNAVGAGSLGSFDAACIFEAVHDMGDPVGVLASVRNALAEGASLLVADERVGASFSAPADFNDRFMYGWSVLHCLPATMAEDPVVATGTVMRQPIVHRYATEAGFASVEELDIDNAFWRFYRLVP